MKICTSEAHARVPIGTQASYHVHRLSGDLFTFRRDDDVGGGTNERRRQWWQGGGMKARTRFRSTCP